MAMIQAVYRLPQDFAPAWEALRSGYATSLD